MKRCFFIAASAILISACSTKERDIQTPIQDDVVFYASFEQPGEEGTKVYANENLLLRWTANDLVSIFNKLTYNQEYMFTGQTGANAGGFRKVDNEEFVTGNAISHVVSVYPYQETTTISEDEVISVMLPSEQFYAENTFGLGANTMVSVSEDNVLQYKNVGGYLMLKLYGEGVSVSSITLKGNKGEKLAGKASVTMPPDGVPTVTMANDATTEIILTCETPVQLGETEEKSTLFWFVVPPVTFSEGFSITVSNANGKTFEKSTTKSITIERNTLSKMSPMETPSISVPDAVDLGLPSGLKWASFNLGASKPEEYGDYYAWGETEPKSSYSWENYLWSKGTSSSLTKYCTNSSWGFNGFTDGKTILENEDDAAYVNYGSGWRMPKESDWQELIDNCSWIWTTINGVYGRKVISNLNGNSIFLPSAGGMSTSLYDINSNGYYWSSSVYTEGAFRARYLSFHSGYVNTSISARYEGLTIRPVLGIPVTSISLSTNELELVVGESSSLVASVFPTDATDTSIFWSSSDESVATVTEGTVTGLKTGTCVITVSTDNGLSARCSVRVHEGSGCDNDYVDLGLSVKWATCNLGATSPEEYGNRYAWGEITGKTSFSWDNYKWCNGSENSLTKYCCDSNFGTVDNKVRLDKEDDAAFMDLGDKWRMPTIEELVELKDNCEWTKTTFNGVDGFKLTSKRNHNSIFLPAATWGYYGVYYSSSLLADHSIVSFGDLNVDAETLYFEKHTGLITLSYRHRYMEGSIRPVYGDGSQTPVTGIYLDKHELTIPVGRTKDIVATVLPNDASDRTVLWESSNPNIATVNAGSVLANSVGNCVITAISHDNNLEDKCYVTVVPKSDPSFYSSTDFSKDGEVVLLHKATVGKGVNLILLGDGFVDTDMAEGGRYDQIMAAAMDQFFSYEPYKTFKDHFNLYFVRAVSVNNVYGSEQSVRTFTYEQDGSIYFRINDCYGYAEKVPNPNNQPLKIAVLFNIDHDISRSFCSMSLGSGNAVCFIMGTENNLINHELGGHGFAFLADEYEEYTGTFSEQSLLDQRYEDYGYGANVDYHSTPSTIRWSMLLNDSRYSAERIGIFEGAALYPYGIYRPTENSIMRNHYLSTGKAFNAPSREQIYKTMMRFSVGSGWVYDYEEFVRADTAGREQAAQVFNSSSSSAIVKRQAQIRQNESHMAPVVVDGDIKEIGVNKDGKIILIR